MLNVYYSFGKKECHPNLKSSSLPNYSLISKFVLCYNSMYFSDLSGVLIIFIGFICILSGIIIMSCFSPVFVIFSAMCLYKSFFKYIFVVY